MRSKNEIEFYRSASIDAVTGEIQTWDNTIFPRIIRKREGQWLLEKLERNKPAHILDFGCGAGWLAVLLSSNGYRLTGIDSSNMLITHATGLSLSKAHFAVADGLHLPFQDNSFDVIAGMAIFHHVDTQAAFTECHRVAKDNAQLLLLEPNKLNPIAFLGRMITGVQSDDEEPFLPWRLTTALKNSGWAIQKVQYLFPYSFGLAYLSGRILGKRELPGCVCFMIEITERMFEKIPFLNRLCWVISVEAVKI